MRLLLPVLARSLCPTHAHAPCPTTQDSRRNYPAPNHYPCEDVHKFLRPHNPPLTMAPRYKVPSDKDRKPGPGVYDPEFEAKERPGVTLKFRWVRQEGEGGGGT